MFIRARSSENPEDHLHEANEKIALYLATQALTNIMTYYSCNSLLGFFFSHKALYKHVIYIDFDTRVNNY